MKITWFAAMTFRIHIAGRIVVVHADGAPQHVNPAELVGGAQTLVSADSPELARLDPLSWRPRRRARVIDVDPGEEGLSLYRLSARGLVADSLDEGLLVLEEAGIQAQWNRWADGAVVVLWGTGAECAAHGLALLDIARPRLIALAVTDGAIDVAFDALADDIGDASLVVLEPGMAVEV